jgi:hypothetical protein
MTEAVEHVMEEEADALLVIHHQNVERFGVHSMTPDRRGAQAAACG